MKLCCSLARTCRALEFAGLPSTRLCCAQSRATSVIAPFSERFLLSFSRRAARRPGIAPVKDFLVPRPMFSPVAHQKEGRLHRVHPVFAGDPVEEVWWGFTVIASGDSCSRRSYFHSCFLTSINSLVGVSICWNQPIGGQHGYATKFQIGVVTTPHGGK